MPEADFNQKYRLSKCCCCVALGSHFCFYFLKQHMLLFLKKLDILVSILLTCHQIKIIFTHTFFSHRIFIIAVLQWFNMFLNKSIIATFVIAIACWLKIDIFLREVIPSKFAARPLFSPKEQHFKSKLIMRHIEKLFRC